MKIKNSLTANTTHVPIVSSSTISVKAVKDKVSIIAGFEVTVKKKLTYVPVLRGNYMASWLKVYRLIKPHLK